MEDPAKSGPKAGGEARRAAARLVALTRQMLRCAEAADWDGVMERNALREAQARSLPDDPRHPDASVIRDALQRSLELEEEVRKRMEAERDRLGTESRDEQHSRAAQRAYRQIADAGGPPE